MWRSRTSGSFAETGSRRCVNAAVLRVTVPEAYKAACMACHDDHMMRMQHLTRAQWEKELDKMTGWGAPLNAADRPAVVDFLSSQYKP